jgi:D-alanine-D-alanine ligase
MTIAILYSLPTKRVQESSYLVADEDTVISSKKIARAIREKGGEPLLVGLSEDRITETIRSIKADLIFNLIDWTGVDLPLSLRAMESLEKKGIPFTGATKENFAFVDKIAMKKALVRVHLPTPRFHVFETGHESGIPPFVYPVIVKLAHEHCSVGIEKTSFVKNKSELLAVVRDRIKRFGQEVYAEEFIKGREFQITVLEKEKGPVMLPPAEIVYKSTSQPEFLTFSERWNENDPDYQRSNTVLASLSNRELLQFEAISKRTFRQLGFRDFTRIDARLKSENELMILEANPNPGLDDDELYSMTLSAKAVGLTFPDFIWEIVASALRRARK